MREKNRIKNWISIVCEKKNKYKFFVAGKNEKRPLFLDLNSVGHSEREREKCI